MTHTATLCIGSNCGNRSAGIAAAVGRIGSVASVMRLSQVLESKDVTGRGSLYLNQVVVCATDMELAGFKDCLAAFEAAGGRRSSSKAEGMMPIDIDLVVWDGKIVSRSDFDADYFKDCLATVSAG